MKNANVVVSLLSCSLTLGVWGSSIGRAQEGLAVQRVSQANPQASRGIIVNANSQESTKLSASFSQRLGPSAIKITPISQDDTNYETLAFGQAYLRLAVADLYLPRSRNAHVSVMVNVTTLNKQPLVFKWAYEPKSRQVHSATGQFLIVPYVALNSKTPFEITIEKRTSRNFSQGFGIIQGLLGAAANVFTGNALGTVSTLSTYATATNNLVKEYETRTQSTDVNRGIVFDEPNNGTIKVPKQMIAFFTNGYPQFRVVDNNGNKHILKESTEGTWMKATATEEAKYLTSYKFKFKEQVEGKDHFGYPLGDIAFVVLALERYDPFPNITTNPTQMAATRKHFKALEQIFLKQGTDPTDEEKRKIRQEMITAEGVSLYDSLSALTDTGDVSLQQAKELMLAFASRAENFGGQDTEYDAAILRAMAANIFP